jgi:urease accessory protein
MLLIEKKVENTGILDCLLRDVVVLNWRDRRKSRQKVKTAKGVELALALPTGTILKDGDVLYRDDRDVIVVEAEKEAVIIISFNNAAQAATIAYELGNRHLPLSIHRAVLITPSDPIVEKILQQSHIDYQYAEEVFEPVRALVHHE